MIDSPVIKQCLIFVLCIVAIILARLPSSTTAVPCPPVTLQQPPYSGAAIVITTPHGPPVPQVAHMHNGLPVQTAQLAQMQQVFYSFT